MKNNFIDISFQFDGKTYTGWATPSDHKNQQGRPSSYSVVLNEVYFGHMSSNDGKWSVDEERPAGLVEAAGKQIEQAAHS